MNLKDLFTDHNDDLDTVSALGVAAFVFFILFTGYTVYTNKQFDPLTYATGAAALIAGIGGGYRLKSGVTPTN